MPSTPYGDAPKQCEETTPNQPITMRHIVTRYDGIETGWQAVGRPNTKQDAQRLAELRARINPNRCYRVAALEPELPSFV